MATTEKLIPNYKKLDRALRNIGYSLEKAVADIIDNSVDWKAKSILVRLIQRNDRSLDLVILDDGVGMSAEKLREAMRFGSDVTEELNRLGKFGLGLKLASLSQAKELRVVTKRNAAISARGWLEDGISQGFTVTEYASDEAKALLLDAVPDRPLGKQGTVVIWRHLTRTGSHTIDMDELASSLAERICEHLRLAFHRFLSGKARRIRITIDVFSESGKTAGVPLIVKGLNPFGYKRSGCSGYPKKFIISAEGAPTIAMIAHIWPPNSDDPAYKLPGGANSRQGFYFYRQDRLIHSGGWNGLREIEPHSSLARVEIDIDPSMDVEVGLDVKKSEVRLPPAIEHKIMESAAADGTTFREYISTANETYRTRPVTEKELPLVPAHGVPAEMRKILSDTLRLPQTTRLRKIRFEWEKLEADLVFWVDRENDSLILNSQYRQALLHGLPGSATDLPAIKCLLFLLCREAFRSERMGGKIKEVLWLANLMLREAVRHERTGP